jgi:cell division protein FtsL
MKKQYIFFVLIVVMLYLMYLIVSYKYKEYLINSNIEYLNIENTKISSNIDNYKRTLDYLNTESYKNKVLKEEQ